MFDTNAWRSKMLVFSYFLICGVLFLICLHLGLNATVEKRVSKWLGWDRIFLSALLIGKIVQFLSSLKAFWGINFVQVLILIIIMLLVEMSYRRKRLTFGDPHLNLVVEALSLSAVIVIFI